jgi:hypothetical protein
MSGSSNKKSMNILSEEVVERLEKLEAEAK